MGVRLGGKLEFSELSGTQADTPGAEGGPEKHPPPRRTQREVKAQPLQASAHGVGDLTTHPHPPPTPASWASFHPSGAVPPPTRPSTQQLLLSFTSTPGPLHALFFLQATLQSLFTPITPTLSAPQNGIHPRGLCSHCTIWPFQVLMTVAIYFAFVWGFILLNIHLPIRS